jgi:hypothetical protein
MSSLISATELAWSGVKTLAGGVAGKGWHWRSTDWNPMDKLNVDGSIPDYKTAGKAIQRGVNTTSELAGYVLPALATGGASGGSLIGAGTKSAMTAAKTAATAAKGAGKGLLSQGSAFAKGYASTVAGNSKLIASNLHNMATKPVATAKTYGTQLAKNYKASPIKTVAGTAFGVAMGPGYVAYDTLRSPTQPMNNYFHNGPRVDFNEAMDVNGNFYQG